MRYKTFLPHLSSPTLIIRHLVRHEALGPALMKDLDGALEKHRLYLLQREEATDSLVIADTRKYDSRCGGGVGGLGYDLLVVMWCTYLQHDN